MPPGSDHAGMYEVLRLIEQANQLAASLSTPPLRVFESVSLDIPKLSPPELGCIRLVSWLFVQYFEAGRVGVRFLDGKAIAYDQDPNGEITKHRDYVQRLRTFFQHNLDSSKSHDRGIQETCRAWFREKCNTAVPSTDEDWALCLGAIIKEAVGSLEVLVATLRRIEVDEAREEICKDWRLRASRNLLPHQFEDLIAQVAADMGKTEIDPVGLRRRFYDQWSKHLGLLNEGVEVLVEARKLVEHALLTVIPDTMPITGKDVISELQIEPGPKVGEVLAQARTLYAKERLSKETLLERLRRGPEVKGDEGAVSDAGNSVATTAE